MLLKWSSAAPNAHQHAHTQSVCLIRNWTFWAWRMFILRLWQRHSIFHFAIWLCRLCTYFLFLAFLLFINHVNAIILRGLTKWKSAVEAQPPYPYQRSQPDYRTSCTCKYKMLHSIYAAGQTAELKNIESRNYASLIMRLVVTMAF